MLFELAQLMYHSFGEALKDNMPNLYVLANTYMYAVTKSANAERSFSLYNLIVTPRRRYLSTQSIKYHAFLYYNLRIFCGAIDDENEALQELAVLLPELELPEIPNLPDPDGDLPDHDGDLAEAENPGPAGDSLDDQGDQT